METTEESRRDLLQKFTYEQLAEKAASWPAAVNVEAIRRQIIAIEKFNKTSTCTAIAMIILSIMNLAVVLFSIYVTYSK